MGDISPIELDDDVDVAKTQSEIDFEKHQLASTVTLSDGTEGRIFSRNGRNKENLFTYTCNLCGVVNLPGERLLQTHIAGRKHQTRLNQPVIDANLFRNTAAPKVAKIQMNIAPGEPVPPGMENEVKPVAQLQTTIDRFKEGPMVGLEYIMELHTPGAKEPSYHCVLCDKKGDPRTIVVHITSYVHRIKFLEKHYPTVINELAPYRSKGPSLKETVTRVVQTVCEAIEDHHGRLTPTVHDSADYQRNKTKYLQEVLFEKHFDERTGPKFVEVIDKKMLQDQMGGGAPGTSAAEKVRDPSPPVVQAPSKRTKPSRGDRKSLDSISSIDSVQSISSGDSKGSRRNTNRQPAAADRRNPRDRRSPFNPRDRRSPERRRFDPSPDRRRSPGANRRRSPLPFRREPLPQNRRSPGRSVGGRFGGRRSRSPPGRRSRSPPLRRRSRSPPPRRRSPPPGRHDRSPLRFNDRKSLSPGPEKRKAIPTPKQLALQASEIAHERYKWEKYRCSLEIAVAQIEKAFKEHEKNPEKHPLYPEEWKMFWNRRYKELQNEKKDPSKHDFKPEWIEFWTKRMKELQEEEVAKKKAEIRKKLNLPDEESEKTTTLKEQYTVKVPATKKRRSVESIDSSEDERMSVKSKASSRRMARTRRSRSRSLSIDEDRSRHSRREISRERDRIRERSLERERERDRHSTRERTIDREREYREPAYRKPAYLQQQQQHHEPHDYDEWVKNYYGPNKKVFVRTEFDNYDTGALNFVAVCRLLCAMEEYLGSLGPKVIDLLSKALALEKVKANSADELLLNEDNCMFLETVKEKLKGHLMAEMLEPQMIAPVKKAIKNIASLVYEASKREKPAPEPEPEPNPEPSTPGGIDKAAIAKQLAAALVAQGKTDFTTNELEELINVYVAMAEKSKDKDQPVTTSSFLSEMLPSGSGEQPATKRASSPAREVEEPTENSDANALEGLTDSDLQTLLQNFKDLSNEEQLHLISHLKKLEKTDPLRVEKLRRYVNLDEKSAAAKQDDNYYDDDDDDDANYDDDGQGYGDNGQSFPNAEQGRTGRNQGAGSSNQIRSLVSGSYGGDSPDQQKLVDSEDEDYSYDDVVRAASKNVIPPPLNSNSNSQQSSNQNRRPAGNADFASDHQDGNSNFSRGSNEPSSQLDTQNIIANLMGSLPKSGGGRPQNARQGSSFSYDEGSQNGSNQGSYTSIYANVPLSAGKPPNPQQQQGGGYMNTNRPQFAPIQTANTNMNSMPLYYQQQLQAQQQMLQQQQQQQQGFAGQFGGMGPQGGPSNFMYGGGSQQQQQQQPPRQQGQYPQYGNNFY